MAAHRPQGIDSEYVVFEETFASPEETREWLGNVPAWQEPIVVKLVCCAHDNARPSECPMCTEAGGGNL